MSEPTNVYAPPTPDPGRFCELPQEALIHARHPVPPSWVLVLTDEAVYLAEKFADSGFRFSREELAQNATLVTATGDGVFLTIPVDKKRNLMFTRTAAGAMEEWLGAQFLVLVRRSVRATWGSSIGLGLFFILTTGFTRMSPMDMGWLTLGFGMLACGVLARARPAAWIWWLDGSLSGMLILLILVDVLRTQQSHWRLAFAALLVWTAVNRFRLARHVGERLQSLSSPGPS
jgi:hypothetical protein